MGEVKERNPFTHKLSYILLAMVCIYLVLNFAFISVCSPQFYNATEQGVCKAAHSFSAIAAVPMISRQVSVLKQNGQDNRANTLAYDYAFSWGSALITFIVMSFVTLVMALLADDRDRNTLLRRARDIRRRYGDSVDTKLGIFLALPLAASVFALFDAFWGDFDFGGQQSLANLVHIGNRDLYRVSVDLAFLLLLAIPFLVWGARSLALRRSSDRKH
jgi:predicted PurR-regulated permease PerM